MAPVAVEVKERRRAGRQAGGGTRWQSRALLRPGLRVTLVNICSHAVLVESAARLRPGAHTEMQLAGADVRVSVKGRLDRCYVAALDPLRYRGVLIFDHCMEIDEASTTERE